jgi:hypothetical protein
LLLRDYVVSAGSFFPGPPKERNLEARGVVESSGFVWTVAPTKQRIALEPNRSQELWKFL